MVRLGLYLLLIVVTISACTTPFPFDQYDYTLESLELGVAFPPVANAQEREFTTMHLDELGMTTLRINQQWALREPTRDQYNWDPLTGRIQGLRASGKEIFLTIDMKEFPRWTDALSLGELEAEFRQFISLLLAQFGSDIRYLQYGNEWNWEIDEYRNGSDDEFIALSTALHDEVRTLPVHDRPAVVLGSISIGGLRGIAFSQGGIDNVYFDGQPLYTDAELHEAEVALPQAVPRMRAIIGAIPFDVVDLHLYDDFWNWPTYVSAFRELAEEAGRGPSTYDIVTSEFGGPHPYLEPTSEWYRAKRLVEYVHALDALPVELALYFKLVESPGATVAHPNSYLLDRRLEPTLTYEVIRRFR